MRCRWCWSVSALARVDDISKRDEDIHKSFRLRIRLGAVGHDDDGAVDAGDRVRTRIYLREFVGENDQGGGEEEVSVCVCKRLLVNTVCCEFVVPGVTRWEGGKWSYMTNGFLRGR